MHNYGKQYKGFPKKLKIKPPCDPEIPLLDIYPKEFKSVSKRDICTPCSLQHDSQ